MYELLIVLSNLGFIHISNTDRIFAMIAQYLFTGNTNPVM